MKAPSHGFSRIFALVLGLSAARAAAGPLQSHEAVAASIRSQAVAVGLDLPGFVAMLDDTAAGLIDTSPGLGADYPIWVLPSKVYPEAYSRDSFWTLAGYGNEVYLSQYVDIFSRNAQGAAWNPPLGGQIPTFVRKNAAAPEDGRRPDESTMFWVLGAKLVGRTVATEPYLNAAHAWLKTLVTPAGFAMVSHGWIDAWEPVHIPTVSANNQGLYAVVLRALRDMGVAVTPEELRAADDAYRNLVVDGYLHAYRGSDVVDVSSLMGEALSLYLWDESILSTEAVKGTVARFAEVRYRDGDFLGFKCLSRPDGGYLSPDDFWVIAERDQGNYQNGGSWLLYEALALYAAARHDATPGGELYVDRFVRRLKSEIKYEHSSKELICTGGTCGGCTPTSCSCPDGICGVGGFPYARSGYGWNAFVKRLVSPRGATRAEVF